MELDYLKYILMLLIMLMAYFGLAVPQGALDLAGLPTSPDVTRLPPATPTIEYFETPVSDIRTFTPHTNYRINLRANCSRNANVIGTIDKPVQIYTGAFYAEDGYTFARVVTGGCIAIKLNNTTYGVIQ